MSDEKIKRLLAELHEALPDSTVDAETQRLIETLDSDIHALLDKSTDVEDASPIVEQARQLETQFAAEHPALQRFVREIIDMLTKIGV